MGRPKIESPRDEVRRPDATVRLHRIEEGETLWAIAQRYYGDGNLHAKLAEWNKDRVGSGGRSVRCVTGDPVPAELDGGDVRDVPRDTRPSDPVRADPPKPSGGQWVYVVKRGDVLSTIAQRELGTVKGWTRSCG